MTVKITKPALNLREELNSLKKPAGLSALLEKIGAVSNRIQVSSDMTVAGTATFTDSIEMAYSGGLNTFNLLSNNTGFGTLNILSNAQTSGTDKYINIGRNTGSGQGMTTTITMGDDSSGSYTKVIGELQVTGSLLVPNKIEHIGDADTYLQFSGANDWRVVTGNVERLSVNNTAVVINEDSYDVDFRVETNASSNGLLVDAGNERVLTQTSGGFEAEYGGAFNYTGLTVRNTGTSTSSLHTAQIDFDVRGTGGQANRAQIIGGKTTSGSTTGYLRFDVLDAGAMETRLTLQPDAVVVNENSSDVDFRAESNDLTHALAVDAGLNTVFIGDNQPYEYAGLQIKSHNKWLSVRSNVGNGGVFAQPPVPSGGSGVAVGWNGSNGGGEGNFVSAHPSTLTGGLRFHDYDSTTQTYTELFRAHYSGTGQFSVNESGADIDFRVATDTLSHAFFIDSSSNRAGVGTSTPNASLGIKKNVSNVSDANPVVRLQSATAGDELIIRAQGLDDSSVNRYADIAFLGSNTNEKIEFRAPYNTSSPQLILDSSNGVIMNEGGHSTRDFRVESDANTHMLTVDAGSNCVRIGSSSAQTPAALEIKSANENAVSLRSNSSITGSNQTASYAEGVEAYDTSSLGTVLSIPITVQSNLWRQYIVEFMFVTAEYNRSANAKAGTLKVGFTSLANGATTIAELDKTGNVASVSNSGTSLTITFTSGYTNGLSNFEGVVCYYKVLGLTPEYLQMWNGTLN